MRNLFRSTLKFAKFGSKCAVVLAGLVEFSGLHFFTSTQYGSSGSG